MNNLEKIKMRFNKAVLTYDENAVIQFQTGNKLIKQILSIINHTDSIIDIGCGTGKITQQLLSFFPDIQDFHAIDIADKLLAKAKKLLAPNILIYEHDFNQPLSQQFDLVFANMSLQWSQDLRHTLHVMHQNLFDHGYLAMTLPLKNSLSEIKKYFGINYFYSFSDIISILIAAEFEVLISDTETIVQSFANTHKTLSSLKLVGANSFFYSRQGLRGKNFLNGVDIRELTYVLGYFIARKKSL